MQFYMKKNVNLLDEKELQSIFEMHCCCTYWISVHFNETVKQLFVKVFPKKGTPAVHALIGKYCHK